MNGERPFFSIIAASYNAGEKLRRTAENVLAQTCGDYELIVKDAGSADGSVEALVQAYGGTDCSAGDAGLSDGASATAREPRLRVIVSRDRGIYDGMNQAAAAVRGRYVLFLNCGDYLHAPETLALVKKEILRREESVGSAGCSGKSEREGDVRKGERRMKEASASRYIFYGDIIERTSGQRVNANPVIDDFACYRNVPCHQACFYSAALVRERPFDIALRVRADYEHFLWCYYRGGARMEPLGMVVADYEGGGFSETPENRAVSAAEHRLVTAMYIPRGRRFLFRLYLLVTLQPLREKLAHGRHTAALYDAVKNRLYRRGSGR